jgi:acetyl-CoA carboxylase beta subunit
MSDKIEVKRGTKIEDQAAAKASGSLGILLSQPPSESVEGQWHYGGMTQCPYCGNVGYTSGLSSNHYVTVICGRCGLAFLA